jgi:hypothetical protein
MYIVVDFDGTVVTHDYPRIGKDIGSVPILKNLVKAGHKLILFTMRSDDKLLEAVKWFEDNEIFLYGVQTNPTQKRWTNSPKVYGELIIDDIALGCPLMVDHSISDRPFVNWSEVESLLKQKNIL